MPILRPFLLISILFSLSISASQAEEQNILSAFGEFKAQITSSNESQFKKQDAKVEHSNVLNDFITFKNEITKTPQKADPIKISTVEKAIADKYSSQDIAIPDWVFDISKNWGDFNMFNVYKDGFLMVWYGDDFQEYAILYNGIDFTNLTPDDAIYTGFQMNENGQYTYRKRDKNSSDREWDLYVFNGSSTVKLNEIDHPVDFAWIDISDINENGDVAWSSSYFDDDADIILTLNFYNNATNQSSIIFYDDEEDSSPDPNDDDWYGFPDEFDLNDNGSIVWDQGGASFFSDIVYYYSSKTHEVTQIGGEYEITSYLDINNNDQVVFTAEVRPNKTYDQIIRYNPDTDQVKIFKQWDGSQYLFDTILTDNNDLLYIYKTSRFAIGKLYYYVEETSKTSAYDADFSDNTIYNFGKIGVSHNGVAIWGRDSDRIVDASGSYNAYAITGSDRYWQERYSVSSSGIIGILSGDIAHIFKPMNISLTTLGDANNDKKIDLTDFGILKENFGKTVSNENSWMFGDFNSDNKVNLTDFGLLKSNFGKSI